MYDSRLEGAAVFDASRGALVERVWTVIGEPTASSALSTGTSGSLPYGQRGRLVELHPGDTAPPIPPSIQVAAPGARSGRQPWEPIGTSGPMHTPPPGALP